MRILLFLLLLGVIAPRDGLAAGSCPADPSVRTNVNAATGDVDMDITRANRREGKIAIFTANGDPSEKACETQVGITFESSENALIESGNDLTPKKVGYQMTDLCGATVGACFYPCTTCESNGTPTPVMIDKTKVECPRKKDKLYVRVVGTNGGSGTVSRSVTGDNCKARDALSGYECRLYPTNTDVTLTESPNSGSRFMGWSEGCSGTGTSCGLKLKNDMRVTAEFGQGTVVKLYVATAGVDGGSGTVSRSATALSTCPSRNGYDCFNYYLRTSVTLTANPAGGSRFNQWFQGCSGGASTCTVTLTKSETDVNATFVNGADLKLHAKVTLQDGASGAVATPETPPLGTCAPLTGYDRCWLFRPNDRAKVKATVGNGFVFKNWGESCAGTDPSACTILMSQDRKVEAVFGIVELVKLNLRVSPSGAGTVAKSPVSSITCVPPSGYQECFKYPVGQSVQLTATANSGYRFQSWSDANAAGVITLPNTNNYATANFELDCVPIGSNNAGSCCAGSTRCSDNICKATCTVCVANGSSAAGSCCAGSARCADNVCRTSCASSCTGEDSNFSNSCCSGLSRCGDGYCRSSCTTCVPSGSNQTGAVCCAGLTRCSDGVCRSSCTGACTPNGSSDTAACCSGTTRCSDGYCRTSCGSTCTSNGSNGSAACCTGTSRCSDGYCRTSCGSTCTGNGGNGAAVCCSGISRCMDGYCRSSCPTGCTPLGSMSSAPCCSGLTRCANGYCQSPGMCTN